MMDNSRFDAVERTRLRAPDRWRRGRIARVPHAAAASQPDRAPNSIRAGRRGSPAAAIQNAAYFTLPDWTLAGADPASLCVLGIEPHRRAVRLDECLRAEALVALREAAGLSQRTGAERAVTALVRHDGRALDAILRANDIGCSIAFAFAPADRHSNAFAAAALALSSIPRGAHSDAIAAWIVAQARSLLDTPYAELAIFEDSYRRVVRAASGVLSSGRDMLCADLAADGKLYGEIACARPGRPVALHERAAFLFFADMCATALESASRGERLTDNERRSNVLIGELNHRLKNILALVQSLVARSIENSGTKSPALKANIEGRIRALAIAHEQMAPGEHGTGSLEQLLRAEIEPYTSDQADRLTLNGPLVQLSAQSYPTLALALHELATNAAKYGALSDRVGRLEVTWRLDPSGGLDISWRELGGPPVAARRTRGLGSTLIERAVPFELGGDVELQFDPAGVIARVSIPARHVRLAMPADAG